VYRQEDLPMPWMQSAMESRRKFIADLETQSWSIAELCRAHSVSRKSAYKWIGRYREEGEAGLADRSRAPERRPSRTTSEIENQVVAAAKRWRFWGGRKLRAVLKRRQPDIEWPSKSTIGEILRRHGVRPPSRPRATKGEDPKPPLAVVSAPNDLWRTDFKGWCFSGDRKRCEPLAITDAHSRFAACCELVNDVGYESCWPAFERAFRRYGLPRAFLSDNGPPFASHGLGGLTRMSLNWVRLGIRVLRIQPGKPTQNGGHERFNLTLLREAMSERAATRDEQRRRIQRFLRIYNNVRPHEALADRTPAEVYTPSPRPYPKSLPTFEYSDSMVRRNVDRLGMFSVAGGRHFLSETLAGHEVALQQIGVAHFAIRFGPLEVGLFDEETHEVIRYLELVYANDEDES
jgi:transposase InsO family protein